MTVRISTRAVVDVLMHVVAKPAALAALDQPVRADLEQIIEGLKAPGRRVLHLSAEPAPQSEPKLPRRKTARWVRYPYQMVIDARAMRANQYTYREIADALNREFSTDVGVGTVRDWTTGGYRMTA